MPQAIKQSGKQTDCEVGLDHYIPHLYEFSSKNTTNSDSPLPVFSMLSMYKYALYNEVI